MKAISVIVLLITSLVCCGNIHQTAMIASYKSSCYPSIENKKDSLTIIILLNQDKTYGYDILKYGKVMIHQASIPGASGNKGFNNKSNAQKVAALVINKIRKGEMPPTVTKEELKKLGVL